MTDLLKPHLRRKVHVVAQERGPHAQQLFCEALDARRQREYTLAEAKAVGDELDSCELTVAQWRLNLQLGA